MADKETKPKATTAKAPAKKPAATQTAKAKTATTAKPAAKTAAKPEATAKPATVKSTTAKTATKPAQAKVKAAKPEKAVKAEASAVKPAPAVEKKPAEKPAKAKKEIRTDGTSHVAKLVAIVKMRNFKLISIIALSAVLALCLILGIVFGVRGCNNPVTDPFDFDGLTLSTVAGSHKNKTQVGYSGEIVGTVERYKPVEGEHSQEFSKGTYPKYGSTLNLTTEQKTELIKLNRNLTANGTWVDASKRTTGTYDLMDKDGYLYKKEKDSDGNYLKPGAGVPERLYKHTASVGMYGGNVSDTEPAVVKNLTFRPRSYGSYYSVTGLYAPAGEVIKIQLTEADMTATDGITIHIGQALYNGQANNIWEQRGFNRMPVILNTMNITKETATYDEATGLWTGYVGSFLGGPIYVRSENPTFSVTISGGVNYAHFILGVTTEEEYAVYSKSSAPYFDLEVWDRGVLHSGAKRTAQKYSYNDLYKAAVLWEKIALVTTSVSNQGIVFLYDPFVAAGAAVAFPGRRSVNCPEGWMTGSLDYKSFVTSGSWGNMHEYHHNFQDYGLGSGADGEVTNNGLNLVSYSLFTKISSARQIAGFGGSGLSGWNQYTSATWALQRVNSGSISSTNGLAVYATLLHNLGQDQYIKARGARGVNNYFNKWAANSHQDFTYYASQVSSYGGGAYSPSQAVKDANYPLFVPVSSVYQTGRTYNYDGQKREINTMQPFVIPYGKSYTVDLRPYTVNSANQYESGSVVIAKDFKYSIKNVRADGINGSFVKTEDGVYTFTPNKELRSGKIYVTLEITTKDGAHEWNGHKLDDVDLVLEFQQSHESNKSILERTTYFYTADTAYADAREAYEKGYAGYESKNDRDHSNPTQNCNTDIWYCTENSLANFPKADPELHVVKPYSIDELRGKLYFPEAGTYNIYLRGRKNCALYYSTDGGESYQLGTYIADNETSAGWRTDKFVKLEVEAESWVYFKEVLINEQISAGMASFIGLGIGQWTVPTYTTEVKYYFDNGGKRVDLTQETVNDVTRYYYKNGGNNVYVDNDLVQSETIYKNASGKAVTAEEAANTELVAPTTISYATAYRQSYEFNKEFESDYFYVRSYNYDYKDNVSVPKNEATVIETNYKAQGWGAGMPVTNISDGKNNTYIHTHWQVSEKNPLNLTFDLGSERTINRISFFCRNNNGMLETPKAFTVEGSLDGETWFAVAAYTDAPRNGQNVTVNFDEATLRYCRITITQTHQGNYFIVIGEVTFTHSTEVLGATTYSPDDGKFAYNGNGWKLAQVNSTYGHVFLGNSGDEVSFELETSTENGRLGILSSNKYGHNFEVYIDGQKTETEKLKEDSSNTALVYLTPTLSQGKHQVTIKCTGEANFDSFAIFP